MSKTMSKKEMNDIMKPAPISRCRECERNERKMRKLARMYERNYTKYIEETNKLRAKIVEKHKCRE
jgi:hypothetical protein